MHDPVLDAVLDAWALQAPVRSTALAGGLINRTFLVEHAGGPLVLQELNTAIFSPEVHRDIESVTAHLSDKGLPTPRLVPTRIGGLWHVGAGGSCWRLMTHVGDRTIEALSEPADAVEAGGLLARFHAALSDLAHTFCSVRPGVHDTDAHMERLRRNLATYAQHPLHGRLAPVAERILDGWAQWDGPTDLPMRVIHGDPKISNLRFAGPRALAMIDLDTCALGTIDVELGDALRSWCNPAREDAQPTFDLGLFEAAMRGYAAHGALSAAEKQAVVPGALRIALELAARFAWDALEETYFGWDRLQYPTRGHHNLARARAMYGLAARIQENRTEAEAVLGRIW